MAGNSDGGVNKDWTIFRDIVTGLVGKHVPTRPRQAPNKPGWLTREVTGLLRKKYVKEGKVWTGGDEKI